VTRAPLIRLEGVWKTYGAGDIAVHALAGIDLAVDDGEFVSIMGPSGSGKSTCMNILGCLDVPTSGHYRFRGVAVEGLDRDRLALLRRHYLGFVFQGYNLLPRTSALENVEMPLLYRGFTAGERHRLARGALEAVDLLDRAHHTPAELSGGQQQRVAIARAIVTEPAVLLADEPTGNLDTTKSLELLGLLNRLNQDRGITIVMVTHEPELAALTHRIVGFRDGKVVADGAPEAVAPGAPMPWPGAGPAAGEPPTGEAR